MKKKLVIQFWKVEEALVMQILEQKGLPKRKEKGTVYIINCPVMKEHNIYLRGNQHLDDLDLSYLYFGNNSERDAYLDKMVNAITDELFTDSSGVLKIGEMCEVRQCKDFVWEKLKLLAILPKNYRSRFIVQSSRDTNNWFGYRYARPLCKRTEPKVEECGNVITYTWEEE